jgi:hypothetical protein
VSIGKSSIDLFVSLTTVKFIIFLSIKIYEKFKKKNEKFKKKNEKFKKKNENKTEKITFPYYLFYSSFCLKSLSSIYRYRQQYPI